MKHILLIIAALALTTGAAHAQTTTAKSTNRTSSGAVSILEVAPGAIGGVNPAAGAAASVASSAVTGWNQPQLVMNTGSAPSTSTFNDCGIAWSGGLWLLTFSQTNESNDCKAQRQAIFASQHLHNLPIAFESMCAIQSFRDAVARTNEQQCAQTVAERNKNAPKQVASVQPIAVPATQSMPTNCRTVQPGNYVTCE